MYNRYLFPPDEFLKNVVLYVDVLGIGVGNAVLGKLHNNADYPRIHAYRACRQRSALSAKPSNSSMMCRRHVLCLGCRELGAILCHREPRSTSTPDHHYL